MTFRAGTSAPRHTITFRHGQTDTQTDRRQLASLRSVNVYSLHSRGSVGRSKGAITSKIKHAIKLKTSRRCAVIGCKLKQNASEGCNSCASLAGLVLSFIACFIFTCVIAPLAGRRHPRSRLPSQCSAAESLAAAATAIDQSWRRRTTVAALIGIFCWSFNKMLLVVAALTFKFYRKFYCKFYCTCDQSITLRLQWYNVSTAMRVLTPRVSSHAWLLRPRNECVKPLSIEWDRPTFVNTHLSHADRGLTYMHLTL